MSAYWPIRRDDGVHVEDELRAGHWNRLAAAAGVGVAETVADELRAADMHAVVAERLDVRGEIDELDMLEHRLVHLVLVGGHLLLERR